MFIDLSVAFRKTVDLTIRSLATIFFRAGHLFRHLTNRTCIPASVENCIYIKWRRSETHIGDVDLPVVVFNIVVVDDGKSILSTFRFNIDIVIGVPGHEVWRIGLMGVNANLGVVQTVLGALRLALEAARSGQL